MIQRAAERGLRSDAVRLDYWLSDHGGRLMLDQLLGLIRNLAETVQCAYLRHLADRNLDTTAAWPAPVGTLPHIWSAGAQTACSPSEA